MRSTTIPFQYSSEVAKETSGGNHVSTVLIVLYLALLVMQPQYRFPFLADIHFEKIVVGAILAALLLEGKISLKGGRITFLVLTFYLVSLISYSLSPHKEFKLCQEWVESYWKVMVLYFLVLFGVKTKEDARLLFVGYCGVLLLYQSYSWFDFMNGGSYVWQQGIKRMVGIWSEGIGAANYYGMISAYCLPFIVFVFQIARNRFMKCAAAGGFVISVLSVIFSGTRGAFLTLLFFVGVSLIRSRKYWVLLLGGMGFLVSPMILPPYLTHRYSTVIPFMETTKFKIDSASDEMQKSSAESRLSGLVDALKLVAMNPVLGTGPGSSAVARIKVNDKLSELAESDELYQMHELYGQLIAETGLLGTLIFILIIGTCLFRSVRTESGKLEPDIFVPYRTLMLNLLLVLLVYGFASHTLFRYYWMFAWASCAAVLDVFRNGRALDSP